MGRQSIVIADGGKRLPRADILVNNNAPLDPRIHIYADTAKASFPGTPGYEDVAPFGFRGQPLLGLVPVENKYPYQAKTVSEISQFWRVQALTHYPRDSAGKRVFTKASDRLRHSTALLSSRFLLGYLSTSSVSTQSVHSFTRLWPTHSSRRSSYF